MWEVFWRWASPALLLFFAGLLLHTIWQKAAKYPSARDAQPCGVRGVLYAGASILILACVFRVAEVANVFSYLNAQCSEVQNSWKLYLLGGLPGAAGAVLLWTSGFRLIARRTPKHLYASIAAMWAGGPLVQALRPVLYGWPWEEAILWEIAGVTAFAALFTLYLLLSPRSRNTYGLGA